MSFVCVKHVCASVCVPVCMCWACDFVKKCVYSWQPATGVPDMK